MRRKVADQARYSGLKDYYQKNIVLPFIETLIHQLETRLIRANPHFQATWLIPAELDFSQTNEQLLEKLLPIFSDQSPFFDDILALGNIASVHTELQNWILRWRDVCEQERPRKICDALNSKAVNIELYPNVKVVFIFFISLPVTTCSVERSFSELRLLKTWLRSTMRDERLSCLTLMQLNYNLEIPYEELIQKWAQQKKRLIHVDINDWLSELQMDVTL